MFFSISRPTDWEEGFEIKTILQHKRTHDHDADDDDGCGKKARKVRQTPNLFF